MHTPRGYAIGAMCMTCAHDVTKPSSAPGPHNHAAWVASIARHKCPTKQVHKPRAGVTITQTTTTTTTASNGASHATTTSTTITMDWEMAVRELSSEPDVKDLFGLFINEDDDDPVDYRDVMSKALHRAATLDKQYTSLRQNMAQQIDGRVKAARSSLEAELDAAERKLAERTREVCDLQRAMKALESSVKAQTEELQNKRAVLLKIQRNNYNLDELMKTTAGSLPE